MLVFTNTVIKPFPQRFPAARRRESILEAALTVLAVEGYAGMTTAKMARQLGVSEPILYRHFSSKRAILRALLDKVIAQMMMSLRELVETETDPVAALFSICRAYPRMAGVYQREFRIINQALAGNNDPKIRKALICHYKNYRKFLQALITKGQRAGALRRDIPASIGAWHMIHSALGFLLTQDIRPNAQSLKQIEWFSSASLRGLLKIK